MNVPTVFCAIEREQAHVERRAPIVVIPQLINADRKGRKPPMVAPPREAA